MSSHPLAVVAEKSARPVTDTLVVDAQAALNLGGILHHDSLQGIREGIGRGEGIVLIIDHNIIRIPGVFVN